MSCAETPGSTPFPFEQAERWAWHCCFPDWVDAYKTAKKGMMGRWASGGGEGESGQLANPIYHGFGVYQPFACNLCARNGFTNTKLFTCGGCGIVQYCSKEHQRQDWENHKHDCKALQRCRERMPSVPADARRTAAEWDSYVMGCVEILKEGHAEATAASDSDAFGRQIQIVTRQPKCMMCRTQTDLVPCETCHSVAVCKKCRAEHSAEALAEAHPKQACEEALVALCCMGVVSDFKAPIQMPSNTPSEELWIPAWWKEYLVRKRGDFTFGKEKDVRGIFSLPPYLTHLCDGLSLPLTIVQTMSRIFGDDSLKARTELILHIIDTKHQDIYCLQKYAEISNLIPALEHIKIVFIGPQLSNMEGDLMDQKYHNGFKGYGRPSCKIEAVADERTYDEYCGDTRAYKKPTLCVIADSSLHSTTYHSYPWPETIQAITERRTPTLCTSMTQEKAELAAHHVVQMGGSIKAGPVLNPFRGMRPHIGTGYADSEYGDFGFMNNWMMLI